MYFFHGICLRFAKIIISSRIITFCVSFSLMVMFGCRENDRSVYMFRESSLDMRYFIPVN